MLWLIHRWWWVLAGGTLLLLLGRALSPSGTDLSVALGSMGLFLIIWAVFGMLLAIPMALKSHFGPSRGPRPD